MKQSLLLTLFITLFLSAQSQAEVTYSSSLKGMELAMGNLLLWETSYEENMDLFIIEKSTDGITFKNIGTVEAVGDSKEENAYRFMDTSLGNDKSFYRLKVVDLNGTSGYSQITAINKVTPNQFAVVAYSSTLVEEKFDITIDALQEGQLEYELVSYQGDLIYSEFQYLYAGVNELQINLEDATEGIYKVKLRLDGEEEELIIQRAGDELAKKVNMASSKKIKEIKKH